MVFLSKSQKYPGSPLKLSNPRVTFKLLYSPQTHRNPNSQAHKHTTAFNQDIMDRKERKRQASLKYGTGPCKTPFCTNAGSKKKDGYCKKCRRQCECRGFSCAIREEYRHIGRCENRVTCPSHMSCTECCGICI